MSEFVIEKGIEIPGWKKKPKYPLLEMEIGDSFLVRTEAGDAASVKRVRAKIITSAHHLAKRHGIRRKFVTRVIGAGVRVWRVE